jgi:ribosomal protein L24E
VRIKDELKAKGVLFAGNNIDLGDGEMRVINDQKYDIGSNY